MRKVADFAVDLTQKRKRPEVTISYSNENASEGYCVEGWRSSLKIKATTPLGAAYGVSRSLEAWNAGAVEWLGEQRPLYRRRLLFIEGSREVAFGTSLNVALPRAMVSVDTLEEFRNLVEALCRDAISLGFNGIAFGNLFSTHLHKAAIPREKLEEIGILIEAFGLELVIMAEGEGSYDELFDLWPSCSGLIYRSQGALIKEDKTRVETLVDEAEAIATALQGRADLLFLLSYSTCWRGGLWSRLSDELPPGTSLLFHAELPGMAVRHPFWEELRCSPDISATPLLPIVNSGGIGIGGGLWPLLLHPRLEASLSLCRRHCFDGIIAVSSTLPQSLGLSHSNLWVTGQRLWTPSMPCSELMAMWFTLYRPDIDFSKAAPALAEATDLAFTVSELYTSEKKSYEQWRSALESAFARLKNLDCLVWDDLHYTIREDLPTLRNYFDPFYVDIRRLLFQLMLTHRISLAQNIEERDLHSGFWTRLSALPGQSVRAGIEVALVSEIEYGELSPSLQALYLHNRKN